MWTFALIVVGFLGFMLSLMITASVIMARLTRVYFDAMLGE